MAIERFDEQLDIRSIAKTSVDLSILLSLLLSKEKLLLFRSQHANAFVNYGGSQDIGEQTRPNKSIEGKRVDLDLAQQSKTGLQEAFESIKGFEVQSDLDRKLILGLWKNKEEGEDQVVLPRSLAADLCVRFQGEVSRTSIN